MNEWSCSPASGNRSGRWAAQPGLTPPQQMANCSLDPSPEHDCAPTTCAIMPPCDMPSTPSCTTPTHTHHAHSRVIVARGANRAARVARARTHDGSMLHEQLLHMGQRRGQVVELPRRAVEVVDRPCGGESRLSQASLDCTEASGRAAGQPAASSQQRSNDREPQRRTRVASLLLESLQRCELRMHDFAVPRIGSCPLLKLLHAKGERPVRADEFELHARWRAALEGYADRLQAVAKHLSRKSEAVKSTRTVRGVTSAPSSGVAAPLAVAMITESAVEGTAASDTSNAAAAGKESAGFCMEDSYSPAPVARYTQPAGIDTTSCGAPPSLGRINQPRACRLANEVAGSSG
jgi:hypothetical protein